MSTEKNQISDIFSAKLKEARKRQGKSQTHIAEIAGVGQSAVSAWEEGSSGSSVVPTGLELRRIAKDLRVTVDWLLGLEDQATSPMLLREGPSEGLVDEALNELDGVREKMKSLERAMQRLKSKSPTASSSRVTYDAKRGAMRASASAKTDPAT